MSYDRMLDEAVWVVEATAAEERFLYAKHGADDAHGTKVEWARPNLSGLSPTVGYVEVEGRRYPVVLYIREVSINGHPVVFWDVVGQAVFYPMIKEWLTKNCPAYAQNRQGDAGDFYSCLQHIRSL